MPALHLVPSYSRKTINRMHTKIYPVRLWRKHKGAISGCEASWKKFTGPKRGRFPEIDDAVFKFFRERRKTGLFVSYDLLRKETIKKASFFNIPRSRFKASKGWAVRFMRRMGLALRRRTTICQKLPKDFEKSCWIIGGTSPTYQPERDGKFYDAENGQCRWTGHLSWYDAKLHVAEERRGGGTVENHGVRNASPNSNADSNCWWEKTTTLTNFEKADFTQIRGVSEERYSQGPGKRMDDGGADGVAENSMGSQA